MGNALPVENAIALRCRKRAYDGIDAFPQEMSHLACLNLNQLPWHAPSVCCREGTKPDGSGSLKN
jgi:hypothetical protein